MEPENGLHRKVMRVSTHVEISDLALEPEMTGHGKIYVGARRLVRLLGVEFPVMVSAWTAGRPWINPCPRPAGT